MFVLYYLNHMYDYADLEIIGVSSQRYVVERKKQDLEEEYNAHMKRYNNWAIKRRDSLTAFLFRQKQALKLGVFNYNKHKFTDPDELINWLVTNCAWTDWAWARHYFDVEKITEPLLEMEPFPHINHKVYRTDLCAGSGEGLQIEEVKVLEDLWGDR